MSSLVRCSFTEHIEILNAFLRENEAVVLKAGAMLAGGLVAGGCVYWCGNGGSAADSQHLAAELVGRFRSDRKPLRSVALSTDSSVLTCIANDYDYDDVFARQVEGIARKGDVLVGISTSGNSENVVKALTSAKVLGLKTVALLGKDGGKAKAVADLSLVVPSHSTARVQEMHILIGHVLCELIEAEMGIG